jgi:hypothetical protein
MPENNVLVSITASREKGEIVYKVDCSNDLTNEEFDYYLEELIKGICKWRPEICGSNKRSLRGSIKEKPNDQQK